MCFSPPRGLPGSTEFKDVVLTTVLAGLHVLVLVFSTDLGGALLFFVTYLVMLYVATKKWRYFLSGLGAGVLAALVGYRLFYHVRSGCWHGQILSASLTMRDTRSPSRFLP